MAFFGGNCICLPIFCPFVMPPCCLFGVYSTGGAATGAVKANGSSGGGDGGGAGSMEVEGADDEDSVLAGRDNQMFGVLEALLDLR